MHPSLLLAGALGLLPPPVAAAAAPRLEFISAQLNEGPGREPPPGAKPAQRELAGALRVRDLAVSATGLRITALPPEAGAVPLRLRARSVKPAGPKAPGQWLWTAPWTDPRSPEGWNVRLEVTRRGRTHVASGPIQVFFLPAPPPRGRTEQEH